MGRANSKRLSHDGSFDGREPVQEGSRSRAPPGGSPTRRQAPATRSTSSSWSSSSSATLMNIDDERRELNLREELYPSEAERCAKHLSGSTGRSSTNRHLIERQIDARGGKSARRWPRPQCARPIVNSTASRKARFHGEAANSSRESRAIAP